jgi:hypothetical protein
MRRCRFQGQPLTTAPRSVQTAPHGQPLAPGAQLANDAQLMQLPFVHSQLCPPVETTVPRPYEPHAACE